AAVVEDERAPIPMLALPRVGMLVERRAVELRKAVGISREMAGYPIENDSQAGLMTGVDQDLEVVGRPEAAARRKEPEHMIAPRSRKRMLHHRQQLDVRETHFLHIRHEPMRHLAVGEEAVALFG